MPGVDVFAGVQSTWIYRQALPVCFLGNATELLQMCKSERDPLTINNHLVAAWTGHYAHARKNVLQHLFKCSAVGAIWDDDHRSVSHAAVRTYARSGGRYGL